MGIFPALQKLTHMGMKFTLARRMSRSKNVISLADSSTCTDPQIVKTIFGIISYNPSEIAFKISTSKSFVFLSLSLIIHD